MSNQFSRRSVWVMMTIALAGCAASGPDPSPGAETAPSWRNALPAQIVPVAGATLLPHHGTVAGLAQWWGGLGDPYLQDLIARAQTLSPTVSAARLRMTQARVSQVQAGAAGGPLAEANVGLSRGVNTVGYPVATGLIAGAQASWEIDLFGGVKANQQAAEARLDGAAAAWHDARVSVAAEVAGAYFNLKSCERLAAVAVQQAASVAESARLTQLLVQSGLSSSSQGASMQAARAQAQSAVAQTQTQCRSARMGLMALTGESEGPLLRQTAYDASKPLTPRWAAAARRSG